MGFARVRFRDDHGQGITVVADTLDDAMELARQDCYREVLTDRLGWVNMNRVVLCDELVEYTRVRFAEQDEAGQGRKVINVS